MDPLSSTKLILLHSNIKDINTILNNIADNIPYIVVENNEKYEDLLARINLHKKETIDTSATNLANAGAAITLTTKEEKIAGGRSIKVTTTNIDRGATTILYGHTDLMYNYTQSGARYTQQYINITSININTYLTKVTDLCLVYDNTSGGHVGWNSRFDIFEDGDEHNNGSRLPFFEVSLADDWGVRDATAIETVDINTYTDTYNNPSRKKTYTNGQPSSYTKFTPTKTETIHINKFAQEVHKDSIVTDRKFFSPSFINFVNSLIKINTIDIVSCKVHENMNIEDLPTSINNVRYTYGYLGNSNYTTTTKHTNGDIITTTINGSWNLDKSYTKSKSDDTKHFAPYDTTSRSVSTVVVENSADTSLNTAQTSSLFGVNGLFNAAISSYPYLLAIPGPVVTNITTPDDLYNLMASTNVVDMAASYTVANDIDMTTIDATWPAISIGNSNAAPFLGKFDGQSNGITNKITIGLTAGSNTYFGLFGRVGNTTVVGTGVEIKNVNLTKTKQGYSIITNNAANEQRVGILCGYLQVGTIKDSYVTVDNSTPIATFTLNATQNNAAATFGNYVGSLVGFAKGAGAALRAAVTNCSVNYTNKIGAVNITSVKRGTSNSACGGLIGYALCADVSGCTLTANNTGTFTIASTCNIEAGNARIGGLFGICDGVGSTNTFSIITNCNGNYYSAVALNSTVATGGIISGGYCGFTRGAGTGGALSSIIQNGTITYNSNLNATNTNIVGGSIIEFGGLTGRNQFSQIDNTNIIVIGSTHLLSNNNGNNNATTGGLCGTILQDQLTAIISNSTCTYNDLFMTINSFNNNTGFQGGLVGYNIVSKINLCAIIVNSILSIVTYNLTNNSTMTGYNGGLCGRLENGILTNCTGTMSTINNASEISSYTQIGNGFAYSGGMIGFNFANTTVSNNILTYNSSNLSIRGNTELGAQFVGGIVGNNDVNAQLLQCNMIVTGDLFIESQTTSLDHFTGGIAGSNFTGSKITNCNLTVSGTAIIQSSSPNESVTCRTGGIVGVNENVASGTSITNTNVTFNGSTSISSINGFTINTSRPLFTGGIAGFNFLGCTISFSSITCNNTTNIISTTSSPDNNQTYVGGIIGSNVTNSIISNCSAIYNFNTTLTSSGSGSNNSNASFIGGIAGSIEDNSTIASNTILYEGLTNITANNTSATIIGGIIGVLRGNNNTIQQNTTKYIIDGDTFTSSGPSDTGVTIGLLFGEVQTSGNTIMNNDVQYNEKFYIKILPSIPIPGTLPPYIAVTSIIANNIGFQSIDNSTIPTFETFPISFYTDNNGAVFVDSNGNPTNMPTSGVTTIVDTNYSIDYSNFVLVFYLTPPVPPPVPVPAVEAPCCQANLCTANPQTTDKDASITTAKPGNLTMVTSVNNFYQAVSTKQRTAYSQPIFSSYQAYMQYLQGQNRR